MLKLHLEPLFKVHSIVDPLTFLIKIGFSPQTAKNILAKESKALKYHQIECLCVALKCTPNDLFAFIPKEGINYPENFALLKLKPQALPEVSEYIKSMNYEEAKAFLLQVKHIREQG